MQLLMTYRFFLARVIKINRNNNNSRIQYCANDVIPLPKLPQTIIYGTLLEQHDVQPSNILNQQRAIISNLISIAIQYIPGQWMQRIGTSRKATYCLDMDIQSSTQLSFAQLYSILKQHILDLLVASFEHKQISQFAFQVFQAKFFTKFIIARFKEGCVISIIGTIQKECWKKRENKKRKRSNPHGVATRTKRRIYARGTANNAETCETKKFHTYLLDLDQMKQHTMPARVKFC